MKSHSEPDTIAPPIKPRGIKPPAESFCDECGHPFYPAREHQRFCGQRCRRAHHRTREERGARLYDAGMTWRKTRQRGGFTEFCRMIDGWLADDRAARKSRKTLRTRYLKEKT